MPTYEYMCTACGHQWEAVHSMKQPPLKKCPKCRKNKAQRQVSLGLGFILKGGGWYADLYSSGSSKGASKSTKNGSSEKKTSSGGSKSNGGAGSSKGASAQSAGAGTSAA